MQVHDTTIYGSQTKRISLHYEQCVYVIPCVFAIASQLLILVFSVYRVKRTHTWCHICTLHTDPHHALGIATKYKS